MATAAVLEDTITCCICFNVYRDPHALPCLHTLCKPCIDQLVVRGRVECPECREMTDLNKIRKDFRIQNLIDDQKNTEGTKEETSTVCGMCNEKDKGIVSHCQECEHYMCAGCEKGHKGMRVCRGHTVKPVKDVIKIAQSKLEEGVAQWKNEKSVIADKASQIEDCIKSIQNHREQQIEKTGKHFDNLIGDLERKRAKIIMEIRELNGVAIKGLREHKQVYNKLTTEINAKLNILQEIIDKKDINTLNEMASDMDTSLQTEIDSIRHQVTHFFIENASPIELITDGNKQMDPGICIEKRQPKDKSLLQKTAAAYTTNKHRIDKEETLKGIKTSPGATGTSRMAYPSHIPDIFQQQQQQQQLQASIPGASGPSRIVDPSHIPHFFQQQQQQQQLLQQQQQQKQREQEWQQRCQQWEKLQQQEQQQQQQQLLQQQEQLLQQQKQREQELQQQCQQWEQLQQLKQQQQQQQQKQREQEWQQQCQQWEQLQQLKQQQQLLQQQQEQQKQREQEWQQQCQQWEQRQQQKQQQQQQQHLQQQNQREQKQ